MMKNLYLLLLCVTLRGLSAPEAATAAEEPQVVKEWQGFKMREFQVAGRNCRLVSPEKDLPGKPWIWRMEFFDAYPSVDIALVKAGYYLAYMDVSGMWGGPQAMPLMDQFYDEMVTKEGLNKKTVPEGFSRGGLFALNWSVRHLDRIASIYLDAPACNFKSIGKGKVEPQMINELLQAYGMTAEEFRKSAANPVENLKPLADAHIPIVAVYGEADDVVVPAEHILFLEKLYKEMGGEILTIGKPGVGHHPHSLEDPKPVVDFILAHPQGKL